MQSISAGAHAHSYLRILRRWWWLPILFGVVSAGVTYAGTKALIKPEYGASVTIQVIPLNGGVVTNQVQDANSIATLMTSSQVEYFVQQAIDNCSPTRSPVNYCAAQGDPRVLGKTVCVADSTDRFVTCTTTSRNYLAPPSALNILTRKFKPWNLNRVYGLYQQDITLDQRLINNEKKEANSLNAQLNKTAPNTTDYSALQARLSTVESNQSAATQALNSLKTSIRGDAGSISVINAARASDAPVSPHPARNAILGFIVGIGIAGALIVLLEYLDDTFRSTDEVFESTGLPLIGAVRKYEGTADEMGMVAAKMPRTAIAEAYRVARANIQFTEIGANLKVLVVTSARDGEGKTTTANNLATTFALAGQRVLLVDADLRRPGLTKMLGMRDSHGLSSVLLDPDADVIRPTEVVGLSVVPSGAIPPNPAELLGSPLMRAWIEKVASRFDLIVLDTPPVLSVADTRILATLADAVILILDPAITTRRMVRQARLAVENVGGRLLGIMLNRDVMRGEGYYYNYYYYEKSAYGKADREREQRRAGR